MRGWIFEKSHLFSRYIYLPSLRAELTREKLSELICHNFCSAHHDTSSISLHCFIELNWRTNASHSTGLPLWAYLWSVILPFLSNCNYCMMKVPWLVAKIYSPFSSASSPYEYSWKQLFNHHTKSQRRPINLPEQRELSGAVDDCIAD